MRRALIVVAVAVAGAFAVAGCQSSSVPMAGPGEDNAGKQFAAPPPGMGAVYFFNPTSASPVLNVRANGREIGRLGTQTWMRAEFAPGPNTFHCWGGSSTNQVTINLAPGDMRFIDVEMQPGQYVCTIREADPGAGRAGVLNGSRAAQY
jgi:hypothetical protein